MRKATDAELAELAAYADPIFDQFIAMPGQMGLHALCYIASMMVMSGTTTIPKVEAWDRIAASIRRSIEDNVKRGLS